MSIKSRNDLGSYLNSLGLSGNGIEIGVYKARFSHVLLSTSKLSKIYLLDAWKHFDPSEYPDRSNLEQNAMDQMYLNVVEAMKQYGERVVVLRKDSRDAFLEFQDGFFDFMYIDANHAYEFTKADLTNWYPKLKSGGVFSGHDYFDNPPVYGVKSAVDEFCGRIGVTLLVTGEQSRKSQPSWYFVKP